MRIDHQIERLEWDDWNREHIGKHEVRIHEIDEVVTGRTIRKLTYKGRLQLIDPTVAGRMLSIVVGPRPSQPGSCYVFSARPANRPERRRFERESEGVQP